MANTNPCFGCGFWESDEESCSCPSTDMWYACPIESDTPENREELEKYAAWVEQQREEKAVLDAAKTISKWCKERARCNDCLFYINHVCIFLDSGVSPDCWGSVYEKEGEKK